jgi:hypothetical protein
LVKAVEELTIWSVAPLSRIHDESLDKIEDVPKRDDSILPAWWAMDCCGVTLFKIARSCLALIRLKGKLLVVET